MAIVYKTNAVTLNSTSKEIEELCSPVKLQSKEVDVLLSDVKTEVKPDEGFDGFYEVVVNHSPVESNTPFKATSNGQYTITPSEGFDATTGVNLEVEVKPVEVKPSIDSDYVNFCNIVYVRDKQLDMVDWSKAIDAYRKFASDRVTFYSTGYNTTTSTFYFKNIIKADSMFVGANIQSSDIYVADLVIATSMFQDCSGTLVFTLHNIDQGYANTFPQLKSISHMFDCSYPYYKAETLGGLNTPFCCPTAAENAFKNSKIKNIYIDLSECDAADNSYYSPFSGCSSLENLYNVKIDGSGETSTLKTYLYLNDCTNLTQESVNNILESLADVTSDPKSITFASTQYAYVTDEQKEAATAKGWSILSA